MQSLTDPNTKADTNTDDKAVSKPTFNCEKCGFISDKNSKLVAHCKTQKHIVLVSTNASTNVCTSEKKEVVNKKLVLKKDVTKKEKEEEQPMPRVITKKMVDKMLADKGVKNAVIKNEVLKNAPIKNEDQVFANKCICDKTFETEDGLSSHMKMCKSVKTNKMIEDAKKQIELQEQEMAEEIEQTKEEIEIAKLTKQVKHLQAIISTQNEQIIELIKISSDDPYAAEHITKLQDFLQNQCHEVVQLKDFLMVLIKKIANEASIISAGPHKKTK
jgi:hypothetical protein